MENPRNMDQELLKQVWGLLGESPINLNLWNFFGKILLTIPPQYSVDVDISVFTFYVVHYRAIVTPRDNNRNTRTVSC